MRHGVALVTRPPARGDRALGRRGLGREAYFAELAPRLRRVIDNDASCWHTLDPHTRLMTSDAPHELIERGDLHPGEPRAPGRAARAQRVPRARRQHVRVAGRAPGPGGHPGPRHAGRPGAQRALPRSAGAVGHPPRAARGVRDPRSRLGRRPHRPPAGQRSVRQRDADALAHVAGAIAQGIRASLRFDAARRGTGVDAPGLVVVGRQDESS